tara:strand:+ start:1854 stop:2228 length:375 start_codon:yes stop_codon:yes gene_type:complete
MADATLVRVTQALGEATRVQGEATRVQGEATQAREVATRTRKVATQAREVATQAREVATQAREEVAKWPAQDRHLHTNPHDYAYFEPFCFLLNDWPLLPLPLTRWKTHSPAMARPGHHPRSQAS